MKAIRLIIAVTAITAFNSFMAVTQDFWQQMNGPYGGHIEIIRQHPNGSLYAVHNEGSQHVLYCSTDNGEYWESVSPGFVRLIGSFAIDSSGILYLTYLGYGWGALRSDDLGQNWKEILPADSMATAISADRDGGIYTATSDHGLFYSTNRGDSWEQIGTEIRDNRLGQTLVTSSDIILVVSLNPTGIYRSTNGGKSWEWAADGITGSWVNSLTETRNGDLFVGLWSGGGINRSTDGGESWFPSCNGVTSYAVVSQIAEDSDGRLFAVALNEFNRMYCSDEHGANWYPLSQGLTDMSMISVLSAANGTLFAGGSYGGVFRSTDHGLNWENKSTGMLNSTVENLVNYNNSILACVKGKGVERSYDGGNTWTLLNNGLTNGWVRNIAVAPNGYWFVCTWGDGVFRSTDEGQHWEQKNEGIICSWAKENRSITVNPNGHVFLGMDFCTHSIYRSTDNGDNWEPLNTEIFRNDPVVSFAHFGNGDILASAYWLYRSTDDGDNWYQTNCPSGAPGLLAYPDGRIYVASIRNFHQSGDYGGTWISDTICNVGIFSAHDIVFIGDGLFYVCGSAQYTNPVYRSSDSGETWLPVTGGIMQYTVNSLLIDSAGYLYAGSSFHSLYRSKDRVVGIPLDEPVKPNTVKLYPNYPNPFNPATTIRFDIPKAGKVKVVIYNTLGQEVQTLFDGTLQAGSHNILWDANQYASGIYLCRLKTEYGERVRKMMFIK